MKQLAVPKKTQLLLLQFTKGIVDTLLLAGKAPIKTPGRPKKKSLSPKPTVGKKPMVAKPIADVRFDETHHWPDFEEKRNRCRLCSRYICQMWKNVKCTYASRMIGIVSSNFIIKKYDFTESKYHLNVLNVIWILKECQRFY